MRSLLGVGFLLLLIFAVISFLPAPEARATAEKYFTAEEIDTGLQFSFQRKLFAWSSTTLTFLFLTVLAGMSLARRLADRLDRWTGGRWLLTLLLLGAACYYSHELLQTPLRLLSLEHLRQWGLATRSNLDWFIDYAKGLAIGTLINGFLLVGIYLLLRWCPRWSWAIGAVAGGLLGAVFAWLVPVVINPLFNTFTPLEDPDLSQRVRLLAERAGVPVREVLVMDASRYGVLTNAYFTGFGPTRRIVLYDTLLQAHKDAPAEIESIIAHEIGHWIHHHIYVGLALGTLGAFPAFFILVWLLQRAVGREPFRLRHLHDPAGLPLLLLLAALGAWVVLPIENAVSRHFERQADQAALDLAQNPKAFIAAEIRMARTNKSNVAPHPLSVLLFATHPPVLERIRHAEEWERQKKAS